MVVLFSVLLSLLLLYFVPSCSKLFWQVLGYVMVKVAVYTSVSFVKIIQVMCGRYDMFPAPLCESLAKIKHELSPLKEQQVLEIINVFKEQPSSVQRIGSGAAAEAWLVQQDNGEKYALKIWRHTRSLKQANKNHVLDTLLKKLDNYFYTRFSDIYSACIEVLNKDEIVKDEFDNLQYFYSKNWNKNIVIPKPLFCVSNAKQQALAMSYLEGPTLADLIQNNQLRLYQNTKSLVNALCGFVVSSIFILGRFHGDLHPDNIVLLTGSDQIGIIDFGVVYTISEKSRNAALSVLTHAFQGDLVSATLVFYDHYVIETASCTIESKTQCLRTIRVLLAQLVTGRTETVKWISSTWKAISQSGAKCSDGFSSLELALAISESSIQGLLAVTQGDKHRKVSKATMSIIKDFLVTAGVVTSSYTDEEQLSKSEQESALKLCAVDARYKKEWEQMYGTDVSRYRTVK